MRDVIDAKLRVAMRAKIKAPHQRLKTTTVLAPQARHAHLFDVQSGHRI